MDFAMLLVLALVATFFLLVLHTIIRTLRVRLFPSPNLPPGSLGWPLIGETLNFFQAGIEGKPEKFIKERMEKHNSQVFKTSLLGEPLIVFCGPAGHKFLFGNENKVLNVSWPSSVKKLFKSSLVNVVGDDAKSVRRLLMTFLNPDALKRYTQNMAMVAQQHISTHWQGKQEVKVYSIAKLYTFELACHLFASIDDPERVSYLSTQFSIFLKGILDFPINIPGTRFYHSLRAADAIRKELQLIARQRREALDKNLVSPSQDLLSHLLVTADASGRLLSEGEIIDNILLLLFAGHDTSRSAIALLMKYLAELPDVYEKVFQEQHDIAKSKEPGELLQWADLQKMKYSWNVASEVLRLSPPVSGAFREAIVDFTYAGYTIPKGWKLYWSIGSTHKDPALFSCPESFDASRFEGGGPTPYSYVPFGGGPRMCLGHEFARLEILVFLHYVVTRFKWDLISPEEKVGYDPMLAPSKGLPIRLQPHSSP